MNTPSATDATSLLTQTTDPIRLASELELKPDQRKESDARNGIARIWDELTGLIADFIHDARLTLGKSQNSFLSVRTLLTGFLAQLSVAIFINRTLAQMPQVFDAFSQAVPFAIALYCFAVSLLIDRFLTAEPVVEVGTVRNSRVAFPRLSRFMLGLRVTAARYRLLIATMTGALTLIFGAALIFFYHSVVVQVDTDQGMRTLLFATPEPQWLSDWKVAIRDTGGDPVAELMTFNFTEVANNLRYDARHGIAMSKTILALLFTMVTMFATITFTLMFQRKDRIEELLESNLVG